MWVGAKMSSEIDLAHFEEHCVREISLEMQLLYPLTDRTMLIMKFEKFFLLYYLY